MLVNWAIIVVNYKLKDVTADCIDSLLKSGAPISHILVVDNGSNDDSVEYLQNKFGTGLEIKKVEKVLGYANGLNIGIKHLIPRGIDWLLLMSNDVIVAPNFLHELHKAIQEAGSTKIIGPLILYFSNPNRIWMLGNYLIPGLPFTYSLYKNRNKKEYYPVIIPVDFISGCTMLIHKSVFEEIGFFDSSLYMYAEEVDFFYRARNRGFQIAVAPRAQIWHKIAETMRREKTVTRYYRIRNQIWIYRRYTEKWKLPLVGFLTFLRVLFIAIKDIFSTQHKLLSPLFKGFYDGWIGE